MFVTTAVCLKVRNVTITRGDPFTLRLETFNLKAIDKWANTVVVFKSKSPLAETGLEQ